MGAGSVVDDAPTKADPPGLVELGRNVALVVDTVLANGRVLRVSETIVPDVLGRLAAALHG
ncbi:hypothetical protein [Sabulicella rubraurantiaca]|uniref:hypothetical protein n=1 Tax=Sabulicella rubraurantiaca TaxID=2811429 RepID=UPI001A979485|nr:hypothetical protein [Sabulicella rubraurantiaca]